MSVRSRMIWAEECWMFSFLRFLFTQHLLPHPVLFCFTPSTLPPPLPHFSFSLRCYARFCRKGLATSCSADSTFFPPPHSLPLCSLPLPPLSLSSPPFLPLSRLRSLQPVNFQTSPPPKCSYSLPPPFLSPSIFLISFQIFALQCPYSSSAPSCPAKIRRCGCPGLLTLYYWAERAALQKLTIHIIPTAWGGGLHFLLCVTTVLASPVLAHVQRIHGQYFLKGTGF